MCVGERSGRRNHYELRVDLPLGEPVVEDGFLRDLVAVIQAGQRYRHHSRLSWQHLTELSL